ncbi:MAG TPA: hypothetical protein VJX94_04295 [Stellaceae bacterium]|nr:hypothetical protein [Stellaceae bacterium]
MTDDTAVLQIIAEIAKHGGATGVSFHQRPNVAARYPTEAILTVVRMLAEEADAANDSAMAAGLRAMLKEVDPNLPIEIEFAGTGPLDCITERTDEHGYWWRYQHSNDEPRDTLTAAITIAGEVAANEARKSGKTYVVASTPMPAPAVYVFACDHPDASKSGISIMYQLTPGGQSIRRSATRH